MIRRIAPALSLLAALAAGCASSSPPAAPLERGPTYPYGLRVAVPEVAYQPTAPGAEGTETYSVAANPSILQHALREACDERGLFERNELLQPLDAGEAPLERAARLSADLVLEARIRRQSVSYRGTNGLYIPNIFVWGFLWVPSWWVPDETYAFQQEVEVELRSVRSGRSIYWGVHRVDVEKDLDDFERGWLLWGIFRAPDALGPDNWRRIDRAIAPEGCQQLAREVAGELREELLAKADTPEFRRAMARRRALVIGVSRHEDPRLQSLAYADADATEFHDHLVERSGIPAHNVRLLRNGKATAEAIRAEISRLGQASGDENDEIVVYFAGYGASVEGRPHLLPHDASPDDLAGTSIPLDELAPPPTDGPGPRVTIVLDAPFTNQFLGRGSAVEPAGDWGDSLETVLAAERCQVLTGARLGEGCIELEDLGQGIFTYYLLRGLEGQADRDRDGEVTWEEACRYASRMVRDHAGFEGKKQSPEFHSFHDASTDPGGEARDT